MRSEGRRKADMILDRKPFIYIWAPFYRVVFEGFAWPVLRKLGGVATTRLAADVQAQMDQLQQEVRRLQQENADLRALLTSSLEAQDRKSMEQWTAIEQLLVCALRERGTDA